MEQAEESDVERDHVSCCFERTTDDVDDDESMHSNSSAKRADACIVVQLQSASDPLTTSVIGKADAAAAMGSDGFDSHSLTTTGVVTDVDTGVPASQPNRRAHICQD